MTRVEQGNDGAIRTEGDKGGVFEEEACARSR